MFIEYMIPNFSPWIYREDFSMEGRKLCVWEIYNNILYSTLLREKWILEHVCMYCAESPYWYRVKILYKYYAQHVHSQMRTGICILFLQYLLNVIKKMNQNKYSYLHNTFTNIIHRNKVWEMTFRKISDVYHGSHSFSIST